MLLLLDIFIPIQEQEKVSMIENGIYVPSTVLALKIGVEDLFKL